MFGNLKLKTLSWSVISSVSIVLLSCTQKSVNVSSVIGETQGTTYTVTIVDSEVSVTRHELDSIFKQFDNSLSTYVETSLISEMNKAVDSVNVVDTFGYVGACYQLSQSVYQFSNGAFDPSVYPLIKGYGFMDDLKTPLNDSTRNYLLQLVSFEKDKNHSIRFDGKNIKYKKLKSEFKLDFNAIAQGLSVDVIADFLDKKGIDNYYVEVGGELKVKGLNKDGIPWRIGVDVPKESNSGNRELENILSITNKALATSGNYRKFYEVDGKKYSHTIDPKSGLPVKHSLLSATVVADNCAVADAYATTFMVIGADSALKFVAQHPELKLDCYLLVADSAGHIDRRMSSQFEQYLAK